MAGSGDTYSGFLEITRNYEYDKNGNTVKKTTGGQVDESVVQYTYNAWNQLIQFMDKNGVPTTYTYDGTGMRNSKTTGEVIQNFYWDRGYIANEAVNGEWSATNYIGNDGIFARKTDSPPEYMLKNGHGDVMQLIDGWTINKSYDYDAYGVEKNVDAEDDNPFRYCGEYYDSESGLIYLRNRYYDPSIGRFVSEDPAKDGLNWYIYCNVNPVKYIDPYGLDAIILTNEYAVNSGDNNKYGIGDNIYFGHQGVLVQDENNEWIYFSCGSNYVQYVKNIDLADLIDLETFSDKYYGGGRYTTSTYISGDFAKSAEYFNDYYEKNKIDGNTSSYDYMTNNCSTVVMEGILKGKLNDGTSIFSFMSNGVSNIPNVNKELLKKTFFNSAFTYDEYYKAINDQLWEARNGFWMNPIKAEKLEKLYY